MNINRLTIEFNYEHLEQDFHCYRISRPQIQHSENRQYSIHSTVKELSQSGMHLSLHYASSDRLYILIPLAHFPLDGHIAGIPELHTWISENSQIVEITLTKRNVQQETDLQEHGLLQLFLNLIHTNTPSQKDKKYQLLSGKLFIQITPFKSDSTYYDFLRIQMKRTNVLSVTARGFSKLTTVEQYKNFLEKLHKRTQGSVYYPLYKKSETGNALEFINQPNYYLKKGIPLYIPHTLYRDLRAHIDFLDFRDSQRFTMSKVGTIDTLIAQLRLHYKDYIPKLELHTIPSTTQKYAEKPTYTLETRLLQYFQGKTVVLYDTIESEESKALMKIISASLDQLGIHHSIEYPATISAKLLENPMLKLIHDKSYYKDQKIPDPYIKNSPVPLQQLNLEHIREIKNLKALSIMSLKELAIKIDIHNSKAEFISMGHSPAVKHTVVKLKVVKDNDGESNEKKLEEHRLTIEENFCLKYAVVNKKLTSIEFTQKRHPQPYELKSKHQTLLGGLEIEPEGWIENEKGQKNYIYLTPLQTLPDVQTLGKQVRKHAKSLPDQLKNPQKLALLLQNEFQPWYEQQGPEQQKALEKQQENFTNLIAELETLTNYIDTPRELKKTLNTIPHTSKLCSDLKKYLDQTFNLQLVIPRGNDSVTTTHRYRAGVHYWEEELKLSEIMDSKSSAQWIPDPEKPDGNTSNTVAFYATGEWLLQSITDSQDKAFRVRTIVPENDAPLFFKDLLGYMNEHLSPTSNRPARLLPFKYLTECIGTDNEPDQEDMDE